MFTILRPCTLCNEGNGADGFFGLFQRKRDFLSYMVVCSPSLWSVGTLPVSSPLAAPFICHWQRSHPKPREPVGRSPKTKKTPCLCMMFFELRRQDLKNTPYASVRGPQCFSFCMRHLRHNKKKTPKKVSFLLNCGDRI